MYFLFNKTTLQVLLHTLQVLYMCTLLWFYKHQRDNRVRSKLFVAVSGDGLNGGSDSYLHFRDTCGKRRNINLILDVTPLKEITWIASGERGGQASSFWSSSVRRPIQRCGKCWFKNSLTCRWKWGGTPSIWCVKSALSSFSWGSSHSVSISRNAITVTVCSERKNGS